MHSAGKAVEEAALNATVFEQLAHVFQRVHRVLHGLGGEAVHEVGMHQHARLGERARDFGHLFYRNAFFIKASKRSEATSSPPEIAMQPLSDKSWHNRA